MSKQVPGVSKMVQQSAEFCIRGLTPQKQAKIRRFVDTKWAKKGKTLREKKSIVSFCHSLYVNVFLLIVYIVCLFDLITVITVQNYKMFKEMGKTRYSSKEHPR